MLADEFRMRYKSIPMATYAQRGSGVVELHNHKAFEILSIQRGTCLVSVNGVEYEGKAGDLFCINPLEVHTIRVEDAEFRHLCICFECEMIPDEDIARAISEETLHIQNYIPTSHPVAGALSPMIEKLFDIYEKGENYLAMECTAYLALFFGTILKNSLIEKDCKQNKTSAFCAQVLGYIEQHYAEGITSKEVAEALSYNQSYFCRAFKKQFQMCFFEYLNRYRVIEARKLLESGKGTVTQVASDCGFRTASHFANCFKKYTGLLPSHYKAKKSM